jgi:hypothetical protein
MIYMPKPVIPMTFRQAQGEQMEINTRYAVPPGFVEGNIGYPIPPKLVAG